MASFTQMSIGPSSASIRDDHRNRRSNAIVDADESGWLAPADGRRALVRHGHAGVKGGQNGHASSEDEQRMDEPDRHPAPPRRAVPRMERSNVDQREDP